MSGKFETGKRSQLSRGGRFFGGLIFVLVGVGVLFAKIDPVWIAWVLFGLCLLGLVSLCFWRSETVEENEAEDLVEVARQAIRSEAARLDSKRADLEKVLMAYGEWMEFPDGDLLRIIEWGDEAHLKNDEKIGELLQQESDAMLVRFSEGKYWTDGKFETRSLLLDLFGFMENTARIYNPDSERPILETNLEALLKAVNRASLQVILLLEEVPLFDVKEMNLRKVSDNIRKASKVYKKYEDLQPYLEPVRYLWQGGKFLLTSNPLLAAGWIAGSELIWKGGKKLGKKAMDTYLLSLMRQSLGILAWETAGIFDQTHRYRSPDWVYGIELAHMLSQFEQTKEAVKAGFQELGALPLRSSYDRVFLYRCLAQHTDPKPGQFTQPDLLSEKNRKQIFHQLVEFFESNVVGEIDETEKAVITWKEGIAQRLRMEGVSSAPVA